MEAASPTFKQQSDSLPKHIQHAYGGGPPIPSEYDVAKEARKIEAAEWAAQIEREKKAKGGTEASASPVGARPGSSSIKGASEVLDPEKTQFIASSERASSAGPSLKVRDASGLGKWAEKVDIMAEGAVLAATAATGLALSRHWPCPAVAVFELHFGATMHAMCGWTDGADQGPWDHPGDRCEAQLGHHGRAWSCPDEQRWADHLPPAKGWISWAVKSAQEDHPGECRALDAWQRGPKLQCNRLVLTSTPTPHRQLNRANLVIEAYTAAL